MKFSEKSIFQELLDVFTFRAKIFQIQIISLKKKFFFWLEMFWNVPKKMLRGGNFWGEGEGLLIGLYHRPHIIMTFYSWKQVFPNFPVFANFPEKNWVKSQVGFSHLTLAPPPAGVTRWWRRGGCSCPFSRLQTEGRCRWCPMSTGPEDPQRATGYWRASSTTAQNSIDFHYTLS